MRLLPFSASLVCCALLSVSGFAQKGQFISPSAGDVKVQTVVDSLEHPWAVEVLPDGNLLLTERPGRLRHYNVTDSQLSEPLGGVPKVFAQGQGGLLDLVLAPDFSTSRTVYLTYAETDANDESLSGTALARARLADDDSGLEGLEVIWQQAPKLNGDKHYGSRIVFAPDGASMFVTSSERFQFEPAQDSTNTLGTVVRLTLDGEPVADNPFVGKAGDDAIYSFGNRNIQAAAIDPATGELWVAEMGPMGGDEFNHIQSGHNYGWPTVSWGKDYDGSERPDPTTQPRFTDAEIVWTPTISPSGMLFYSGRMFPEWSGSAMVGGLTASGIVRIEVDGDTAKEVERLPLGVRVRDLVEAGDGSIYVISDADNGKLLRLVSYAAME